MAEPILEDIEGNKYSIPKKEKVTLGRGPGCDITMPTGILTEKSSDVQELAMTMNTSHATIHTLGGTYYIEDAKSRNGTMLRYDGQTAWRKLSSTERIPLINKTTLRLGAWEVTFIKQD